MALCVSAGFQPELAASVNDIGTAVGLVGIGWGVTIAPERTPAGTGLPVARIPIAGVSTARHSILIVRDGEHLLPWISAAITAVRGVSARRWRRPLRTRVRPDGQQSSLRFKGRRRIPERDAVSFQHKFLS